MTTRGTSLSYLRFSFARINKYAWLCACLAMATLAPRAGAQLLYWEDAAGNTPTNGTWDTSTANWSTSATLGSSTEVWPNTTAYAAGFAGGTTANTLTITNNTAVYAGGIFVEGGTTAVTIKGSGSISLPSGLCAFSCGGSGSDSITIIVPLTGVGAQVEQQGSGTLYLYATNTYSGGTILTGGQLIYYSNSASFGTGPIIVSGNGNALLNGTSPAAALTIPNNFVFNAPYALNLVAGAAVSGNPGTTWSGNFLLASPGMNNLETSSTAGQMGEISGVISGAGNLTISDAGILILGGANIYTGTTTIGGLGYATTVRAGIAENPGVSGPFGVPAIAANSIIFGGGVLQFSSANTYDYSSRFSTADSQPYYFDLNGQNVTLASPLTSYGGTLAVSNSGAAGATLTLSGANTYTGTTTINSNVTLNLNALADYPGQSAIGYGNVQINGNTTILYTGPSAATARTWTLKASSTNTLDVAPGVTLTLNGPVTGSSPIVVLQKVDSGILVIGGTNINDSYGGENVFGGMVILNRYGTTGNAIGGATTISNAVLQLSGNNTAGQIYNGSTSPITIANSGLMDMNGQNNTIYSLSMAGGGNASNNFGGALINSASGTTSTLTVTNTLAASAAIGGAGNLILPSPIIIPTASYTFTNVGSGTNTVSGVISGNGSVMQAGSGMLVVSGANTYTNTTTVTAGLLDVGTGVLNSSSGSILSANVTVNAGTLELDRSVALGPLVTLNLPATPSSGMVNLNFTGTQNILSLNFGGAPQASGFWGAPGNPSATYSSPAFSGSGLLYIAGAGGYSNNVTSYWDPGQSQTGTGSGGTGNWDNVTTDWFVTGATVDSLWTNGNIAYFNGATGGTVTLNATVTPGALTFATAGYTVTNSNGNSLNLAGSSGATPITVPAGTTTIASPIIGSASQGLAVSGTGTLVLSGANTYTGTTTINSNVTLNLNALADYPGQSAIGYGNVQINGNTTILYTGPSAATARTWTLKASSTNTLDVAPGVTLTLNGPVTGSSPIVVLQKVDSGILVIGGTNINDSYGGENVFGGMVILNRYGTTGNAIGGATTISNAVLQLSGNNTAGQIYNGSTSPITIVNSGLMDMNGQNNTIYSLSMAGGGNASNNFGGALINSASGTTSTLTVTNTLAASAAIGGAGNLILPSPIIIPSASYTFTNVGSGTNTVSGVISGNGSVMQAGSGTLVLGAPNTYTNATTVTAGMLIASVAGAIPAASPVTVSGTGELVASVIGAVATTNTITIAGGVLDANGVGSISSASNITVTGGVLELDTDSALSSPFVVLNLPASPANNVNLNFSGIQNVLALTIGGASQTPGLWGAPGNPDATQTSPAFSGSGLLYVPAAGATGFFNGYTSYWDPGHSQTGSGTGGNGSWDNVTTDWLTGTADAAWTNASIAEFAGSAGTVTLNADVTPAAMTFATSGYIITNAGSYSLNLAGTNPTSITIPAGTTTIAAPIAGAGATAVISGPGTLVLSGNNTYDGGTAISNGATVSVNTIADSGPSAIGPAGTVNMSNSSTLTYTGTTTATTSRTIQGVTGATAIINLPNTTGDLNMTGALRDISGSTFTVNKTGPGTLTFSGAANNSGLGMNVLGGTVVLGITDTSSSVAALAGPSTVGNGATLQIAGAGTYEIYTGTALTIMNGGILDVNGRTDAFGTLTIAGTGNSSDANGGALINSGATASTITLSTAINLTGTTTIGGNGSITLSGPIGGDYGIIFAPTNTNAVLSSTASSTFTGGVVVAPGCTNTINTNGDGTGPINLGAYSTLNFNFGATTMQNLIIGPSTASVNLIELAAVNTTISSDMSKFAGTLYCPPTAGTTAKAQITSIDFSINPAATINVASSGTLFVTGAGVVVPCTVIFHGTGNTEAYGALRLSVGANISGPVILAGTVNTTIGNDSGTSTISGPISGSNGITFTPYAGTIILSGANTYTGTNIINGEVIRLASPELGTSGPLGEAPGPNTIVFTASVASAGGIQFTAVNHSDYSSRFSSNSTSYSFDENGQTVTFASPIAGIANFTNTSTAPQGIGKLILSAANTYYGTTYLAGAQEIVELNAPDNGTSGPLGSSFAPSSIILAGATLQYTSANQHDYSYRLSSASTAYNIDVNGQNVTYAVGLAGTGTLNLSSSTSGGSLTLMGDNTYSGATYIHPGSTLAISGTGSLGFVAFGPNKYAGAINDNGALNFATGSNNWLSGAIYGAGSLNQNGAALTILSSSNYYYGGTSVSAGTLDITNTGSILGNVTVTGGLLELDSMFALGSNALVTLPASTSTLAVNLNYSGTLSISALYFGTTPMPAGTYGAVGSGATHTYAAFEGTGILNVGTSGFYWDPSPSIGAAPGSGGSGTWDLSTLDWTSGSGDSAWINGNIATFAGAAGGTVRLGVPVSADGLMFGTANYRLTGSTLTLDSGAANSTQLISIPAGATEIDSVISSDVSTNSVIISGPGTMTLTAPNTFTNPIVVSGGTLSFNSLSDTAPCALGPLAAFANGSANNISLYNANLYFTGSSGLTARNVQLNGVGTETLNVPSNDTLEIDGRVFFGNVTGQYGLTFSGGGTLILGGSGDNSSLGMNILAGTVIINKNSSSIAHGLGGEPTALAPGAMLQLGTSSSGGYDLYSSCTLYVSNGAVLDLGGQSDSFGTLYLAGNGFGNGALINSGTSPSTISPAIVLTGNTTIGGSSTSGNITLTGAITGYDLTQSLTYAGPGPSYAGGNSGPVLTLQGANGYTGGLNINSNATVQLNSTTAAGGGPINIGPGGTLIISNTLAVANAVNGTNSSTIILSSLSTANWDMYLQLSGFTGTIDCQDNNPSGGLGAQILVPNVADESYPVNPAATWKIENGVTVDFQTPFTNNPATVQVYGIGNNAYGALRLDACTQSGNVILEGNNNMCQIGSGFNSTPNGPNTISGIISDGGNNNGFVWMSGSANPGCTLVLTAVNTYTGPTVVSNVTILALSGSGSIATSSGISLNSGTLFDVSQTSGTYGIPATQTLANLNGSATIKGNLNVVSGATLNLTNSIQSAPLIVTNGTLTLGGNHPVNISIASTIVPTASGFLLIQGTNGGSVAGTVAGSTITLNGLTPPPGIALQIINGSLYLAASAPVIMAGPNPTNAVIYASSGTRTNSVTFNVTVFGAPTLTNGWCLNGVLVPGATNANVTLSNIPAGTYNVTFGATNSYNPPAFTNVTLTVLPVPTTSFASTVLSLNPFGYWRLNEAGIDGSQEGPNNGVVCQDYIHGNDGIYTNVTLGNNGYDYADANLTPPDTNYDAETSAGFGESANPNSCAFGIPTNVDVSALTNHSPTFTVQAWVQCPYGALLDTINTPTIAAKGYYYNEEFALDCGTHIGSECAYRFTVRNAGGTLYGISSPLIAGADANWHFLVGVCDEVHSNIAFYIDGTNVGTTSIPAGSGIVWSNYYVPMTIGSRSSTATAGYDQQFVGNINDVALFTNVLTAAQVQNEYYQAGIAPAITFPEYVVTNNYNITIDEHSTLVLPCYTNGSPPIALQWYYYDNNTAANVAILNQTNATLTLPNVPPNYGYVFVTASNAFGMVTSADVYLNVQSSAAYIVTQPTPAIVYVPAGTVLTYSVVAYGAAPIYYEWILNPAGYGNGINSVIPGETSSSFTFAAVPGTNYYQCAVSNVVDGQTSGSWSPGNTVEVVAMASPPAVNFNDSALWSLQGSGYTPTFTGTTLEMTSSAGSEAATAFYEIPQYIANGFVASFTFTPSLGTSTRADGTAFVIQNVNSGTPYTALGTGGGDLGLGGTAVNPCVNFDMDLYSSASGGTGINWGTNGATAQNAGAPNGPTGSVNINSEDPIGVVITYTASNNNVNVVLTDQTHPTEIYTTNYTTGNLTTMLGSVDAYVGFAAGTGGSYAEQTISGFSFAYTAVSEGPVVQTDISPTNMNAPVGAPITYSPVVIGTAPLYYHWYSNGNPIAGQTNATLTIIAAAGVNTYQLGISNAVGGYNNPVFSSVATVTASTTPFVVDFSNPSLWQLNSNNVFDVNLPSGGPLTLTSAANSEVGSAYYTAAQYINSGFVASFTYTPSGGTATRADGTAFVLQNSVSGPFALGLNGGGSGLGVYGTAPSVNFNLDLFSGAIGGTGICFATNGFTANASDGGLTNGPTSPVNINSGDPINVTITYQPQTGKMVVTLVDGPSTYTTNYQVGNNLAATVGGDSAYVGFTGATGSDNAVQQISNFSFSYSGLAAAISQDLTPLSYSNVAGSTITYSVVASGDQPISYAWFTNSTLVTGATNASLTLDIPLGTTTVQCGVSNIYNSAYALSSIATVVGGAAAPPPPTISIQFVSGNAVISWPAGAYLFSAPTISGPWTVVQNAVSPYTIPPSGTQQYYTAGTPYTP